MRPDLIGYRCWYITFQRDKRKLSDYGQPDYTVIPEEGPPKLRLKSLSSDMLWDGPIVHADVKPSCRPRNSNGLYALKTIENAKDYDRGASAYGEVAMFGHIVEHDIGWRAEHMLVKRIWLRPFGLPLSYVAEPIGFQEQIAVVAKLLEARYQCDVIIDSVSDGRTGLDLFLMKAKMGQITVADLEKLLKEFGV